MNQVSIADRWAFAMERGVRALAIPFFRPSRVASEPFLVGSRLMTWLFAFSYGMVEVRNAMARRDFQDKPDILHLNTWPRLWLFTFAVGILWAVFAYWAGGWWFQVRLYLSGANPFDFTRARRIYLALCQVTALPGLAWEVGETLFYDSPGAARESPSPFVLGLFAFAVWSIIAEYRAVLAAYSGDRLKIRTWFLTLPLAWPVLFLLGLALVFR